jgi:hypothetical protein
LSPKSSRITGRTAARIGIGCALVGALLAGLVFFILSRTKGRQASFHQQHLPSSSGERDATELAGRGIINEHPAVAELGERHKPEEKHGIIQLGEHVIRKKPVAMFRGWPSVRDRHTIAELDPHDAVHVPDR